MIGAYYRLRESDVLLFSMLVCANVGVCVEVVLVVMVTMPITTGYLLFAP